MPRARKAFHRMNGSTFRDIEKLEKDLWSAADNLRANSKLTSSDYFMPVLGIIFLRHAANRFDTATREIEKDQASGKMPKRAILKADYVRRRALWLPEEARYDWIMAKPDKSRLPELVTKAMVAIEESFEPLLGVLPKDYGIFEPKVLEDLMGTFNGEQIRNASGDVFGRIYEYFLAEFSMQKAHDNGEFFTPSSIVQTIVNVIEPNHGKVLDPACGSGGMFVQSSHFIERTGEDTAHKVVFHGQEKNPTTIRIAQMNLAVHGLEGRIAEAITYYQDEHNLAGQCDFVMANPPFNVDLVDAERIKGDPRLPFGLPGVNKGKKVQNGNYLWISYFWSYLNEKGRAGFVMSSQASSAGHGEKDVRRRIVETGDVDVMVAIRGNFFYTRSVPCELWFFDRGKPQKRRNTVLMIDARQIFRKVTRKIFDFTPEQLTNLSAIVWLHREEKDRFLDLVQQYFGQIRTEAEAVPVALDSFDAELAGVRERVAPFLKTVQKLESADAEKRQVLADTAAELEQAVAPYEADRAALVKDVERFCKDCAKNPPEALKRQHALHAVFDPIAERIRGLIKQVDLLFKLSARLVDLAGEVSVALSEEDLVSAQFDRRGTARLVRQLDDTRKISVAQLRHAAYFHRQAAWLLDRFPNAELQPVPGLVKAVTIAEIEAADWSLTPGRYVGIAPTEEDEDFDFEQTLRDIHTELADLNSEASELASRIHENFEELGI